MRLSFSLINCTDREQPSSRSFHIDISESSGRPIAQFSLHEQWPAGDIIVVRNRDDRTIVAEVEALENHAFLDLKH